MVFGLQTHIELWYNERVYLGNTGQQAFHAIEAKNGKLGCSLNILTKIFDYH